MNRAELISDIADLTGHSKSQVAITLNTILHSITANLARGERITLVGFGTFERRSRSARTGRNPRTMATLRIPASKVPAFRAGQELKDIVNGHSRQQSWTTPGTKSSAKKTTKKVGKSKRR